MCRCYYLFLLCGNAPPPPPSVLIYFFVLACPPIGLNTPVAAVTPLIFEEFNRELAAYPLSKRRYVLEGIRLGFRVGWETDRVSLRSRTSNMRSASDHPDVVDAYLSSIPGQTRGRPVYQPSGSAPSCQPFWCHPQESPAWQVAPYPGSVIAGWSQCQ